MPIKLKRRPVVNVNEDDGGKWISWELGAARRTLRRRTLDYSKRLLTDIEAADYLCISRSALRALVANGALKRVQLPAINGRGGNARLLRIDVRDIDAFIDGRKADG